MAILIRSYADKSRAKRLHDELLDAGLSPDRVRLLQGDPEDAPDRSPSQDSEGGRPGDRGVLSSIGHVLASAMGGDSPDEHTGRHTEALQRGESVITVSARTPAEEGLARAILDGTGSANAVR